MPCVEHQHFINILCVVMLVMSEKYVVKSHQPSTHSNAQNRRRTENEVGRAMKSFCPSLGQRQDQLLTMNSNLQTIRKLCFTYTLCPCYQEKVYSQASRAFKENIKEHRHCASHGRACSSYEGLIFLEKFWP